MEQGKIIDVTPGKLIEDAKALVPMPVEMNKLRPLGENETAFVIARAGELVRIYPLPEPPAEIVARLQPLLDEANALKIKSADDIAVARQKGKEANEQIKAISVGTYAAVKKFIDAVKRVVMDKEDGYSAIPEKVKEVLKKKMQDWDEAERNRIFEEQRKQALEDQRRKDIALRAAQKKLEKLMQDYHGDNDRLIALYAALEVPGVGEEEAGLIRVQISTIEKKINATSEKAREVEQKAEEAAAPSPPAQNQQDIKTATGLGQEKQVTGVNMKVLIKWLASKECTVDPSTILKVQDGPLKSLVQKMGVPGVSWRWAPKTRF